VSVIKAVFFDWFDTLARFEPPREELHNQAFRQFGIELSPQEIRRGVSAADQYYFEENARSPVDKRSGEEQAKVFMRYQSIILAKGGVKADQELLLKIMKVGRQLFEGITFVLFDDVLSTLQTLKQQKFILGLLTNLAKDVDSICDKLGLKPYLDFIVSSGEVGVDKPAPRFFLAALEKAGVEPQKVVHVGDQYQLDIVGARGVGISPILIDRYDLYSEVSDCPRIRNLAELGQYL
jgi:putative hydrolase of the HAD superfamily